MKISKSKQELARIISENGGWRDGGEWATQDYVIAFFSGGKPDYAAGDKVWRANDDDGVFIVAMSAGDKIKGFHNTILSRDEYFHLYPAPDADGWIEWNGGECPVDGDSVIDVKLSDGDEFFGVDADWDWHQGSGCGIIAYRLHKPEQAKPEFCESVMRSIPEPEIHSKNTALTQVDDIDVVESKPTIERLAADYRNLLNFALRKQREADDAKADAEAKLKSLELAGEALGLKVSPVTAKQEHGLVIIVQSGDEVECVESNINRDKYNGMVGTVLEVDDSSTPYLVDFGGSAKIWCHKVKFIRRP